ncbi:MAG TPA: hypothetical protein PKX17_07135, partial [Candidatus Methanomethylicus sp.]|nr:hypothetical protein [Candidatus Methanomethylicus sp.]
MLLEDEGDDAVADCKRIMSERTNALAPGCGLSPYTPLDNLKRGISGIGRGRAIQMEPVWRRYLRAVSLDTALNRQAPSA